MRRALLLLLLVPRLFGGDAFSRLPDWAQGPAREAAQTAPPAGADAWVLLDRWEVSYQGGGELRLSRFRLVKVLSGEGLGEAQLVLAGVGVGQAKVNRIRGWNLRPDGEVVRLNRDQVVTMDASGEGTVSTELASLASLERPAKGSHIAFEAVMTLQPVVGPAGVLWLLQKHPVRRWELQLLAGSSGWNSRSPVPGSLVLRHAQPWLGNPAAAATSLTLDSLPPLPLEEGWQPHPRNFYPWVAYHFADPALTSVPGMGNWDSLAAWYESRFPVLAEDPLGPGSGQGWKSRVTKLSAWMARNLSYRQVYLAPERAWIPEPPGETVRKRFGDCKDLSACLIGVAKGWGLDAHPVLCRIVEGTIEPDEPVHPQVFNHVIVALRVNEPSGLPSEVSTPQGRFLLIDPTSRTTPLGYLPESHRGRRLMICALGKGLWVDAPDQGIERGGLKVEIASTLDGGRTLQGRFKLLESGDWYGLQGGALAGGAATLGKRTRALLGLKPTDDLAVTSHADPFALDVAFEVTGTFVVGSPLIDAQGGDLIVPVAFPRVPEVPQRVGAPRLSPLLLEQDPGPLDLELKVLLDRSCADRDQSFSLDTPFRKVRGRVKDADRIRVITFRQEARSVAFGFGQQEKGVKEAKKDRAQYRAFLGDLLFLPGKP